MARVYTKATPLTAKSFAAVTGGSVSLGASTYIDAVAIKGKESHAEEILSAFCSKL